MMSRSILTFLVLAVLELAACGDDEPPVEPTAAVVSDTATPPVVAETPAAPPAPTQPPATPRPTSTTAPRPTATSPAPKTGTLEVRVTDQPTRDVQAVVVTVSQVEVNRVQSDTESGWVTVVDEEQSFDLLKLVGVEETVGSSELEPARYTQTRLHIASVVVTVDGRDIDAQVPSGILRVVGPVEVVAGETTIATFDFDA